MYFILINIFNNILKIELKIIFVDLKIKKKEQAYIRPFQ